MVYRRWEDWVELIAVRARDRRALSALEGISEEELLWRPVPEMNTTGKILRHLARISLVLLS
jgi:hypothetical protein